MQLFGMIDSLLSKGVADERATNADSFRVLCPSALITLLIEVTSGGDLSHMFTGYHYP